MSIARYEAGAVPLELVRQAGRIDAFNESHHATVRGAELREILFAYGRDLRRERDVVHQSELDLALHVIDESLGHALGRLLRHAFSPSDRYELRPRQHVTRPHETGMGALKGPIPHTDSFRYGAYRFIPIHTAYRSKPLGPVPLSEFRLW